MTQEIYSLETIKSAVYGVKDQIIDVTTIVQQQNNIFKISNQLFGDPCFGIIKELVIT